MKSARQYLGFLVCCLVCGVAAGGDLSGTWVPKYHEDWDDRIPGPELGDYAGVPINEEARLFAESWDPSRLTLPEHQCRVHTAPYIFRGPMLFRAWEERNQRTQDVERIRMYISTYEQDRTIYMDGREHPPAYAAHTWMGFSTGKWDGKVLTVKTTHLKQNWHRRNGLPQSDQAELTEHFYRHGDYLTRVSVTADPVYLTEPVVKSEDFVLSQSTEGRRSWTWPCGIIVEVPRPQGEVPFYLPGQNPNIKELDRWQVAPEAWQGGAATLYPNFAEDRDLRLKARTP